jgi:hypothetical protein
MSQKPSKETIDAASTFDYSLYAAFTFSDVLEAKVITLRKPGKDPKFPKNLCPISLLSTRGKLFEKVVVKMIQRHIEERCMLNAGQIDFHARHSMRSQCMRFTDHMNLNFSNIFFILISAIRITIFYELMR